MSRADLTSPLIVQPREGTLTRVTGPITVRRNGRVDTCIVAVCSADNNLVLVRLHVWRDGSHRPKSCAACAKAVQGRKYGALLHARFTPAPIVPFYEHRRAR